MKNRILSLFFVIVMLMGMMPTAGLAQPEAEHFSVTNLAGAELSDGDYVYSGDVLTVRVSGGEEPYTSVIQIQDNTDAPIAKDSTGSLTYAVSEDATWIVILCQYTAEHETADASYTLYVKKPTLTVTRNGEELTEADAIYAGDTLVASCDLPNATFRWYCLGEGNTEITLGTNAVLNVTKDMLACEYIYINVLTADGSFIDGFALIPVEVYTVTIAPTTGGTVTADKETCAEGEIVTLTVTPDAGYELESLAFALEGAASAEDITDTRTFTMPAGNVTVTAVFKQTAPTTHLYNLQLKALGENDEVLNGSLGAYVGSIFVDSSRPNTIELPVGNSAIEFFANENDGYKFPAEAALNVSADGQLTVAQGTHVSIEQDGDVSYIVVRLESSLHPITVNVNGSGSGRVKVEFYGNEFTEAEEGKQLTVLITPDNGHAFASLVVNGENVTDRVRDAGASVQYDFTMPDEAVTVTVTFISLTFDLQLKLVDEENNEISTYATGYVDGNAIIDNSVHSLRILEPGSHTLVFASIPQGYVRPEDAVLNVDSNGNLTSGSSHATVEKVNDVWFIIVSLGTKQPTSYQYKLQLKALGENDEVLSEPFAAYIYAASVDSNSHNTVELPVGNIPIQFQINHNAGYKFPESAALNVSADGQLTVARGSHISIEQEGDVYYIVVRLESSIHPITVNVNGSGSAKVYWLEQERTEAEEGWPIKLDIIPDEGYTFASLIINGTDVTNEAVELINGEFTYEFTMPDDDVTIVVSFRENPSYEFSMRLKLVDEENNTIDVSAHGLVGDGLVYTYQDAPRTLPVGSNTFKLFYVPDGYLRPEDAVLNVDANGNLTSGSSHVAIQKDGDVYCIVVTLEKEAVFSVSLSDDLGNEDISAMDVGRTYTIHAEGIPDGYIAAFYVADRAEGFFQSLSHSSPFTFTQEIYDEYTELLDENGYTFDCFYAIVWDGTDVNTVEWWELLPINAPESTYTVTVTTDGNGTASASPASGATGTEVTLTATPSTGYQFKEWQVISGGVTVENNKFTIGTANVEIKAIFEAIPVPAVPQTGDESNLCLWLAMCVLSMAGILLMRKKSFSR